MHIAELRQISLSTDKLRECTHHCASSSDAILSFGFFCPHRSSNVQMCPSGLLVHKLLQEKSCCDGATNSWTGILHVGKITFEALEVALLEGHSPEFFASGFASSLQASSKIIRVAPQACNALSERHHASSSQRGDVHNLLGTCNILAVEHGIGQSQPSLCIGVVDLNGGPVHCGDDVSRAKSPDVPAYHVFTCGDDKVDLNILRLQLSDHCGCSQRAGCSAHVELHQLNHGAITNLQVVAT
mmetsp:Transcript_11574/g.18418  ORF Transcript_11574/g.18418 Transcript_11574/m.18418 type:complete len:242 (-) Transcript_11574:860-1585(-)